MNIPTSKNPRIVIIGGGFAGIALAKKLKNKKCIMREIHALQETLF